MKTPLSDRIKELEQELSQLNGNIRTLAKTGKSPRKREVTEAPRVERLAPVAPPPAEPKEAREPREPLRRPRDERFVDYLASSFEPNRPLIHEQRVQRNKAILTICCVLVLLFWILHRILF